MSGPTVPTNRSAAGARFRQRLLGVMARFLPLLTMVGFTLTLLPSSGCGKGIFTEVIPTTTATIARTASSAAGTYIFDGRWARELFSDTGFFDILHTPGSTFTCISALIPSKPDRRR